MSTNKILGFTILAPFVMIRPAPIYPPAILHIAAIIPNRKSTCPLKEKDTKRRDICGQINDFSLCVGSLNAELCKHCEGNNKEGSGSRSVKTIIHPDDESGDGCGQVSTFIQRNLVSTGVIE